MTPTSPTKRWFAPGLLVSAALLWAGNHVIARSIAGTVPPWTLNLMRWLVVALLLGVFANRAIATDWPVMRQYWRRLALLGAAGGGMFGTLQFVALQHTTVINMGVLNSVAPAFIVAASVLLFRDAVRPVQLLGVALSFCGVLAMITQLDPQRLAALAFNRGDLIIVANMVIWAFYSACLRLRPPIKLISFLFALSTAAALVNLPFAVIEFASGEAFPWTAIGVGALAYAAVGNSILAYLAWSRGVELLGPSRASIFLHVIPLANAALGVSLFGEPLRLDHLVGFMLILLGVALTSRRVAVQP